MSNSEISPVGQTNRDVLKLNDQAAKSAELYCKILSELNNISLRHTKGLLNIAVKAAEAVHSLASVNGSSNGGSEIAELAGHLKNKVDEFDQKAIENDNAVLPTERAVQSSNDDNFNAAVEKNIITAMENSSVNQQQLNVAGEAILTQAVELIFAAAAQKSKNSGG